MSLSLLLFLRFMLWFWYPSIGASQSCGSCLQPPAFISNFTTIRAQSDAKSTLTIDHGLGEVPIRVEVQVRPSPGRPDTEYVFPGLGSAQADDDLPRTYGGVVYKYNDQSVVLAVPKKNNGNPSGVAIYTAGSSYREFEHGLAEDPEYVSVQVKSQNTDWYSDGIGSSTRRLGPTASWGGVIYGANNSHVRVWAPHLKGLVFFAADGWSMGDTWTSGFVKVRVWGTFGDYLVYNSTTSINSGLNRAGQQIYTPYLDLVSGLIDVKIKSIDGLNNGFYFPASGAVQNAKPDESYGGVVYSYSKNGVRFWHPHLSTVGSIQQNYLVYIDSNWGGGINLQASTSGDLVIRFWNSSVVCSTSTTTMSTTAAATATTFQKQYVTKAYTQNGSDGGVSKLAIGLIIAACLLTAGGCGVAGYFGARKMKNSKNKNKISTES